MQPSERKPCRHSHRYRNKQGYAVRHIGPKGRQRAVYEHRYVYEQTYGPIPEGMTIDHLCHGWDSSCAGGPSCLHRRCVEPTHLEAVPAGVNTLRGRGPSARHAAQTHCINGHEFTPSNTYVRRDTGGRQCRTCSRNRDAARKPSPLQPRDPRHGTTNGYNYHRCRCQACHDAMAAHWSRRRVG